MSDQIEEFDQDFEEENENREDEQQDFKDDQHNEQNGNNQKIYEGIFYEENYYNYNSNLNQIKMNIHNNIDLRKGDKFINSENDLTQKSKQQLFNISNKMDNKIKQDSINDLTKSSTINFSNNSLVYKSNSLKQYSKTDNEYLESERAVNKNQDQKRVSEKNYSLLNNQLYQNSINLKDNDNFMSNNTKNQKDKDTFSKSNYITSQNQSKSKLNLDSNGDKQSMTGQSSNLMTDNKNNNKQSQNLIDLKYNLKDYVGNINKYQELTCKSSNNKTRDQCQNSLSEETTNNIIQKDSNYDLQSNRSSLSDLNISKSLGFNQISKKSSKMNLKNNIKNRIDHNEPVIHKNKDKSQMFSNTKIDESQIIRKLNKLEQMADDQLYNKRYGFGNQNFESNFANLENKILHELSQIKNGFDHKIDRKSEKKQDFNTSPNRDNSMINKNIYLNSDKKECRDNKTNSYESNLLTRDDSRQLEDITENLVLQQNFEFEQIKQELKLNNNSIQENYNLLENVDSKEFKKCNNLPKVLRKPRTSLIESSDDKTITLTKDIYSIFWLDSMLHRNLEINESLIKRQQFYVTCVILVQILLIQQFSQKFIHTDQEQQVPKDIFVTLLRALLIILLEYELKRDRDETKLKIYIMCKWENHNGNNNLMKLVTLFQLIVTQVSFIFCPLQLFQSNDTLEMITKYIGCKFITTFDDKIGDMYLKEIKDMIDQDQKPYDNLNQFDFKIKQSEFPKVQKSKLDYIIIFIIEKILENLQQQTKFMVIQLMNIILLIYQYKEQDINSTLLVIYEKYFNIIGINIDF